MNMQSKTVAQAAAETKSYFEDRFGELGARLSELEQKGATINVFGGGGPSGPSAGQKFVDSDEFASLKSNLHAGRRVGIETKATITSLTTDADGSAGDLVVTARDATYVGPKRRLTVRDLLPVVQVSSGSVEYAKQTGSTNSADTVAEATTKPQSELKYDLVTESIRTIAHWVIASRQILDDAPQLRGLIDTELLHGLALVEEDQLLNGGGTGTDLNGIYTQATAFAAGSLVVDSPNEIDAIGAAILQNALAENPASGVIVHPSDWTAMRMLKDGDGKYILGDPAAEVAPRLFGLPVVATQALSAGNFLVGNFQAATLYDRWEARVEVSTEDSDNFRKNLVTVLAEERIGLAVKDTTAFTKGAYSTAITDLAS